VRRGRRVAILCAAGVAALSGCRRARDVAELPDALAGFTAAPAVTGPGWVRRRYARGPTRVDVTLARAALPPGGFDEWVAMSQAFPQAALDAAAADANGFYQCTEQPAPSCDLLIQLRSGVHVEIRGGGTSSRQDVDAIARALPLRQLATGH
jgi:hypothetical protein